MIDNFHFNMFNMRYEKYHSIRPKLGKMHFSIPDTQEFIDGSGNTYLGYNIHINGLFHCTVRYKQLLNMHVQLAKELDSSLPEFPPKKLFPLTVNQQEERRSALEKYVQSIGQNPSINRSYLLNGFLLHAQLETAGDKMDLETLDVYLMNGCKIQVHASPMEHSGIILSKVCGHIGLVSEYERYFSLYFIHEEVDGEIHYLRKLQSFESPLITREVMPIGGRKLILAKNYWDSNRDDELICNDVALDLIYIQAISDIQRRWIPVSRETRERLTAFQNSGNKAEYMKLARTLKYYGYMQFAPCVANYPQAGSRVLVSIGKNELNLRVFGADGEECEALFKVTRMRCWRVTTLHNIPEQCSNDEYSLEISFEYLMARNQLQWITIASEQAILMSVCLQAMIDELLIQNVSADQIMKKPGISWTYVRRDGSVGVVLTPDSVDSIGKTEEDIENDHGDEAAMKKLTNRLSSVSLKKGSIVKRQSSAMSRSNTQDESSENNAFDTIGDDDL